MTSKEYIKTIKDCLTIELEDMKSNNLAFVSDSGELVPIVSYYIDMEPRLTTPDYEVRVSISRRPEAPVNIVNTFYFLVPFNPINSEELIALMKDMLKKNFNIIPYNEMAETLYG